MNKIINLEDLKNIKSIYKNKVVGLAHGVFDLFHYGHLLHLKKAKKNCDILIVSVTSSKFVNKGNQRPIYSDFERLEMIASLTIVDHVVCSNYPSSYEIIKKLKPNVYFKGSDYKNLSSDYSKKILQEKKILNKNRGRFLFTDEKTLSSTKLINYNTNIFSQDTKNFLKELSKNVRFENINDLLNKIKNMKILVIGEIIFDKYIFSVPLGKSPKEQLIPVKKINEEIYGGGTIATANHLVNFVKNCTLLSIFNSSNLKEKKLLNVFLEKKIKRKFFNSSDINITKTRYLEKSNNQKLFQVSNIESFSKITSFHKKILKFIKKNAKNYDIILAHDFGHGLFDQKIINILEKYHKKIFVNVQTNSSNIGFNYITKYKNISYFTIDEPEARLAVQKKNDPIADVIKALKEKISFNIGCITSGKNGAYIFDNNKIYYSPALDSDPVDTLGAGDAFFAISSLFAAVNADPKIISLMGNIAGAIKIKHLGHRKYIDKVTFLNYVKSYLNF